MLHSTCCSPCAHLVHRVPTPTMLFREACPLLSPVAVQVRLLLESGACVDAKWFNPNVRTAPPHGRPLCVCRTGSQSCASGTTTALACLARAGYIIAFGTAGLAAALLPSSLWYLRILSIEESINKMHVPASTCVRSCPMRVSSVPGFGLEPSLVFMACLCFSRSSMRPSLLRPASATATWAGRGATERG
jgi:hypothetical protein